MTKEEILDKFDLDFPSEKDREYYTNQILKAMEQYRNEGLGEELFKYTIWYEGGPDKCRALEKIIRNEVNKYLFNKHKP